jgi:hypothetical protein
MAKPYVDIAALPRLLVRPRRTFEELRPHTGPLQGAMVALVLIVVAGVVDYLIRWIFSNIRGGASHQVVGMASRLPTLFGIVLAFVAFLLMAGLTYRFVAGWGQAKRPEAGMTVGLMGYAMFPVVILGIAMSVVMAYYSGEVERFVEGTGKVADDWGGWGQYWVIYWVMVLIVILWGVRIQAKAASVANDSPGMRTLGCVAAAWVASIVFWIVIMEAWLLLTTGEFDGFTWLPW